MNWKETKGAYPFSYCINPHCCNPAAHGNVLFIDIAKSKGKYFKRRRLVNGRHVETGEAKEISLGQYRSLQKE